MAQIYKNNFVPMSQEHYKKAAFYVKKNSQTKGENKHNMELQWTDHGTKVMANSVPRAIFIPPNAQKWPKWIFIKKFSISNGTMFSQPKQHIPGWVPVTSSLKQKNYQCYLKEKLEKKNNKNL